MGKARLRSVYGTSSLVEESGVRRGRGQTDVTELGADEFPSPPPLIYQENESARAAER